MKKRSFLLFFLFVVFGPASGNAETLVILKSQNLKPYNETIQGILSVTKRPATIFNLEGDPARINRIATELGSEPAMFVAIGAQPAVAVRTVFPRSPLIFALVPRQKSGALKGERTTGVYLDVSFEKQLQLIREILPQKRRVGIVLSTGNDMVEEQTLIQTGQDVGMDVIVRRTSGIYELSRVLNQMVDDIDFFMLLPDSLWAQKEAVFYVRNVMVERNIPFTAFSGSFVKMGALIALSPDYSLLGQRVGELVEEVSSGGAYLDPSDPPVRIIVNKKLMSELGITIPETYAEKVDFL